MWDEQFEDILRQYLPFLCASEELTADTGLRDLGLDSMGIIEMLAALESAYEVRFLDEALTAGTFATPGALWTTLSEMTTRAA
jgi:acyl carrier protein